MIEAVVWFHDQGQQFWASGGFIQSLPSNTGILPRIIPTGLSHIPSYSYSVLSS